jgi:aspartyl-tRNA(Asn)/glutamyl-tRNA(Gln) amidotransferase subunit C
VSELNPLTREEVIHVAGLARLELSDEEVTTFTAQLGSILNHAADIASLNLEGLSPMAHPFELENVLRADEPAPSLSRDELLKSAPSVEDGRFKVGRILGEAP